jgi:integral membrane sensor domain MASE1
LVEGSTAPPLTIWYHWLTSNVPGIVAVAPLLIGSFPLCAIGRRVAKSSKAL